MRNKRILIMLLAFLIVSTAVFSAMALPTDICEAQSEMIWQSAEANDDSDELFEGYVEQKLYWGDEASPFATSYGEMIFADDPVNLEIYRALKYGIKQIAANGGYSTFSISDYIFGEISAEFPENLNNSSETAIGAAAGAAIEKAFYDAVDVELLLDSLLIDCSYELYWFDKVAGYGWTYWYSYSKTDGYVCVTDIIFSFQVSEGYRVDNYDENDPAVMPDVAIVSTATQNARAVVANNAELSDREKLDAYKDYICDAVTYNHAAADDPDTPYGDVWQMIYVFDEDPATNVVCEGYSKAFSYLCELSDFEDPSIQCYIMTGDTNGPHMWNVVTIGNTNYLADITNTDEESIGDLGGLYLVANPRAESSSENGYTFDVENRNVIYTITYTYDYDTVSTYPANVRKLGARPSTNELTLTLGLGNSIAAQNINADFAATHINDGITYSALAWVGDNLDEDPMAYFLTSQYKLNYTNWYEEIPFEATYADGTDGKSSVTVTIEDMPIEYWYPTFDGVYEIVYEANNKYDYTTTTQTRKLVVLTSPVGDINFDKNVNIADANMMQSMLADEKFSDILTSNHPSDRLILYRVFDVNADGIIDENDIDAIRKRANNPLVKYY